MHCDNPIVSIIVPVYNTPYKTLEKSINIFIKNEFDSVEIIVVDDGSSLSYTNFITDISSSAKTKIVYKKLKNNSGQNLARSAGVDIARGDYIAFLDSDDYFNLKQFNSVLEIIQQRAYRVYSINATVVDEEGHRLYDENLFDFTGTITPEQALLKCGALWHWIIDTKLIKKFKLCCDLRMGEDLITLIPIIMHSTSIMAIDAAPYCYVDHCASVTKTANVAERLKLLSGFNSVLADKKDAISYQAELEWLAIWHILIVQQSQILNQDFKNIFRYHKKAKAWVSNHFPSWRKNPYLKQYKASISIKRRIKSLILLI